jgi:2-(1,2-epoxy-1,2-dihydrophenyl)acetyl-CoA isomerase
MLNGSNIVLGRTGAVGTIVIDRRERLNSLDPTTARDLRRAALGLARDEAVRVIVLQGAGGAFCSGADLKYVRDGGCAEDLAYLSPAARDVPGGYGEVFRQILEYLHSTISEVRRAPKPVVAAVDGVAAAGGFGLAMACDVVVASERATFEWAYPKTGLTGAESATFLLPRLLGLRRALDLVFLNPRLDARRAFEMGLVSAVHPTERFADEVAALAERLAAGPTRAFATTKTLVNAAAGLDRLDPHLDRELEELVRAADSPEFAAGLGAFFEKRPARFEGG